MKDLSKRYLVTPEEYQRIKSTSNRFDSKPYSIPHPDAKNAAKKHSDLKDILSTDHVSDFDKVLQYTQGLRQYLSDLKNAVSVPKATAILGKPFKNQPPPPPPPPSPQPNQLTETSSLDAFSTPVRTPSLFKSSDIGDIATPSLTKSRKKRRNQTAKFSESQIIKRADITDRPKFESVFKQLPEVSGLKWNKTTGVPTLNDKRKTHTTIEALVGDYIANKPTTSGAKTLREFQELLDPSSSKKK